MNDLAIAEAKTQGVDPDLVCAICEVESSWSPWAVRFEPGWRYFSNPYEWSTRVGTNLATERTLQAMSYGLMQVMGSVCRDYGYNGPLMMLASQPEICLKYSVRHLKNLIMKYGTEAEVVAAYNAGSPRKTPGGFFVNQDYVNKVFTVLRNLRTPK